MTARLLVYTRTTAYRHDSIPAGVEAVRTLGDFEVDHTEDPQALETPLDAETSPDLRRSPRPSPR